MRLNKHISETGLCSRREADALIAEGLVSVNGLVAGLGTQVTDQDEVRVRGELLGGKKKDTYIAFHKPVGVTCTTERHVQDNIIDYIGHTERIFPIGRLDKDSEGLILLTNNGDIVNEILRVENRHEKVYLVTVDRAITLEFLKGMTAGVPILETVTLPCQIERLKGNEFRIVLTQGLNRQIRRMCDFFGYKVRRLQRVRVVNIKLGDLPCGHWRDLSATELAGLLPNRFGPNAQP